MPRNPETGKFDPYQEESPEERKEREMDGSSDPYDPSYGQYRGNSAHDDYSEDSHA